MADIQVDLARLVRAKDRGIARRFAEQATLNIELGGFILTKDRSVPGRLTEGACFDMGFRRLILAKDLDDRLRIVHHIGVHASEGHVS